MKKLSEEDLNTIKQHNWNLYEIYLTVENGCQSDITIEDITECMGCICCLLKGNMDMTAYEHKICKEMDILKDIICHQAAKIIQLEDKIENRCAKII
ncbi:MAG: hypothetical protein ACLS20_06485 [Faecalimonas umbilicata]|uniref:hypothetical protein n=1 Tax=Faecalimonas umbilicata TaxID=1912855 RepID=UPI003991597C